MQSKDSGHSFNDYSTKEKIGVVFRDYFNQSRQSERTQIAAIIMGILIVIGIIWYFVAWIFGTHAVVTTVSARTWVRQIQIDRYVWTEETDTWGFPSGSRNQWISTSTSTSVSTTSYCSGSGSNKSCSYSYSTRTSTTTYYHYQIREWTKQYTVQAIGTNNTPYSPAYTLQFMNTDEPERADPEHDTYTIHFKDVKSTDMYTQTFPQTEWATIAVGTGYTLQVDHLGQVRHSKVN